MPLLDELRKYNPSIGKYEKSMMTESFDYSVKLSNGLIRLPEELVSDYERSPDAITLVRIKSTASKFVPSNATIASPSSAGAFPVEKPIKGNRRIIIRAASIAIAIIIIIVIAILLISRTQQRDKENAARIHQELLDSEKTARLNQEQLDSANAAAKLNKEKLDSINTAQQNQEKVAEAAKIAIRNTIRFYVTASRNAFTYKLVGSISNLKITVTNNTAYTMDAVKVRVAYIKQDGGVYKYEELSFNGIAPNSQMTLNAPDSDRGTHVQFAIETISSSQLGL